jgi:hypothetical protein
MRCAIRPASLADSRRLSRLRREDRVCWEDETASLVVKLLRPNREEAR